MELTVSNFGMPCYYGCEHIVKNYVFLREPIATKFSLKTIFPEHVFQTHKYCSREFWRKIGKLLFLVIKNICLCEMKFWNKFRFYGNIMFFVNFYSIDPHIDISSYVRRN